MIERAEFAPGESGLVADNRVLVSLPFAVQSKDFGQQGNRRGEIIHADSPRGCGKKRRPKGRRRSELVKNGTQQCR